jgi:hypothetical protein
MDMSKLRILVFEGANRVFQFIIPGMDHKRLDEKFRKIGGGHDLHTQGMSQCDLVVEIIHGNIG